MSIIAFLSYVIITSITPGPSNILMMNEARKAGFIGAWRFNSGILIGFALLGITSGVFTTGIYTWIPFVKPYFKMAGAAYLLYLAWQLGVNKGAKKNPDHEKSSFLTGFIIQMINIKSILFFLTVMSAFILPFNDSVKFIIFYLTLTIFLGWFALLLWSGTGSILKNFLAKHDKVIRIVMSAMLVYSAVTIFL